MRILIGLLIFVFSSVGINDRISAAILVAGWDFQTTDNGGTATAASPGTPKVYSANVGSGTLYLDGQFGSSNWFVPGTGNTNTELNGFAGTAINAGTELSTTTSGAASLAFIGGQQSAGPVYAANGKSAVIRLSLLGYQNLGISFAAQRTATGFTSQVWEWSTDGANYNPIGTKVAGSSAGDIQTSFLLTDVLSFSGISGLDDAADAYVRITFDGATGTSGNNRIDNLRFEATAIPEPGTLSLLGLAVAGLGFVRSRR